MTKRENLDTLVDNCLNESNIKLKEACNESRNLALQRAIKSDMDSVLELVHGLAEYEKEPDAVKVNSDTYVRDGFGSSPPFFHCILLIDQLSDRKCGMALWYIGYSTLDGPYLYLEDLFILNEYRQRGAGTYIMRTLAKICDSLHCNKFVWQALDWNTPALNFYRKINATILPDRTVRMDRIAIQNFLLSLENSFLNGTKKDFLVPFESLNNDSIHKTMCSSIDRANALLSNQISFVDGKSFRIRHASGKDLGNIMELLGRFAKSLEKSLDESNSEAFLRNSIDGMSPVYHCMIIEDTSMRYDIGFCIWHFGYSTWEGRTIQISDIFIEDSMNKLQVMKYIIYSIAFIAQSLDCSRLVWNEAPLEESDNDIDKVHNDIGAVTLHGWLTLNMTHSSILKFIKY